MQKKSGIRWFFVHENSIDDGIDLMTQLWNLSIGEVKDFNKHVEEIIK